jgi:hypothetical protein
VKIRLAAVVTFVVVLLAIVFSCVSSGTSPMAELTVIKQELTKNPSGATVVKVTVKNTGRAVAELAEVTVTFYDAGKGVIDSTRDSVLNLNPNETWDFEIACKGERCGEVRSYAIKVTAGSSKGGL